MTNSWISLLAGIVTGNGLFILLDGDVNGSVSLACGLLIVILNITDIGKPN
jgi:hypothetical protein